MCALRHGGVKQLSTGKRASLYNAALATVAAIDLDLAQAILDTMSMQGVRPDVVSFCLCASAAQRHGDLALADALLRQVRCMVRRCRAPHGMLARALDAWAFAWAITACAVASHRDAQSRPSLERSRSVQRLPNAAVQP